MNRMLITMAAVSALSIGAPAAAQNFGFGGQSRVQQLQVQLQAGMRSGAISRREAPVLRERLRQLTQLERLYGRDGFSGRERADLQRRTNALRQQIRFAARADGRYDRDDRDDRYGRDDDDRYGRGDDGRWNDGDRDGRWSENDRDGRWSDDDRDGRWSGDDRDGRSLAVGSRITANAGAVPAAYRARFRDGGGYYYRYGNGNIYQVDARTNLIVRVYAERL